MGLSITFAHRESAICLFIPFFISVILLEEYAVVRETFKFTRLTIEKTENTTKKLWKNCVFCSYTHEKRNNLFSLNETKADVVSLNIKKVKKKKRKRRRKLKN